MHTQLVDALSKATEESELVVLMIDLDGFKLINDTHGHSVGDQVLRTIGHRLAAVVRPSDTVARTGGDEFVAICPTTGAAAARDIANRMFRRIAEPITTTSGPVSLGVSIGIAVHQGTGGNPATLLELADRAMYRAKHSAGEHVVTINTKDGGTRQST